LERIFASYLEKWISEHTSSSHLVPILDIWRKSLVIGHMTIKDAIGILEDCDNETLKAEIQKIMYDGLSKIIKKTAS